MVRLAHHVRISACIAAVVAIGNTTPGAAAERMSMPMSPGKCPWVTPAQVQGFLGSPIATEVFHRQAPQFGCLFETARDPQDHSVSIRLTRQTYPIEKIAKMQAMFEHGPAKVQTIHDYKIYTDRGVLMAIRGTTLVSVIMHAGAENSATDGVEFVPLAGLMFLIKN